MFTVKDLKKAILLYTTQTKSLRPKNNKKYVGVELECIIPFPSPEHDGDDDDGDYYDTTGRILLLSLFSEAGLANKVRCGYDGSIKHRKMECGVEVRILDTEKNIFDTIEKVCQILTNLGARVNNSCGLHVHLDMRNRPDDEISMIFDNLLKSQDYLRSLVAKHRIRSTYCKRLSGYIETPREVVRDADGRAIFNRRGNIKLKKPKKIGLLTWDAVRNGRDFAGRPVHYHGLNMGESYDEQSTFEIRFHEATLDSVKVNKWIATLLKITKVRNLSNVVTVENAEKLLKLGDTNVRTY